MSVWVLRREAVFSCSQCESPAILQGPMLSVSNLHVSSGPELDSAGNVAISASLRARSISLCHVELVVDKSLLPRRRVSGVFSPGAFWKKRKKIITGNLKPTRKNFSWIYFSGENVPDIPGACATCNFAYLVRGPWDVITHPCPNSKSGSVKHITSQTKIHLIIHALL